MLSIVYVVALAPLPRREQIGMPATSNRQRFTAQHPSKPEPPSCQIATRHPHHPIDAPDLCVTSRAALVQELSEGKTVPHDPPGPCLLMDSVHRRALGQPCRARGF